MYLYVGKDPLNNSDPTGEVTFNFGVEAEAVTPDHQRGEKNQAGGGFFVSFDKGQLRIGTYVAQGERGGADAGVAVTMGATGGDVSHDFAGKATTLEVDHPIASGEIGMTETGKPTVSVEFGTPVPGASAGETEVIVTSEVNVNEAVGAALDNVAHLPDRIAEATGQSRPR